MKALQERKRNQSDTFWQARMQERKEGQEKKQGD